MDEENEQDTVNWEPEEFEKMVTTGIVACYESEIAKSRAPTKFRLTEEDLRRVRRQGIFFPSPDRFILSGGAEGSKNRAAFDVVNDPIPMSGNVAMSGLTKKREGDYSGYVYILSFRRADKLPPALIRRAKGIDFELNMIIPDGKKVRGEKRFLTLAENGEIFAFDVIVATINKTGQRSKVLTQSEQQPHLLPETEWLLSIALQYWADRRFCWDIQANDVEAKVHLGCTQEEIKSLMYARELPMTETGRKRPILHIREAHKRRLRDGTTVDIPTFLSGTQVVDVHGTCFTVRPPLNRREVVSTNSQRYYDAHQPTA